VHETLGFWRAAWLSPHWWLRKEYIALVTELAGFEAGPLLRRARVEPRWAVVTETDLPALRAANAALTEAEIRRRWQEGPTPPHRGRHVAARPRRGHARPPVFRRALQAPSPGAARRAHRRGAGRARACRPEPPRGRAGIGARPRATLGGRAAPGPPIGGAARSRPRRPRRRDRPRRHARARPLRVRPRRAGGPDPAPPARRWGAQSRAPLSTALGSGLAGGPAAAGVADGGVAGASRAVHGGCSSRPSPGSAPSQCR
jgi:hypothetical protein